MMIYNNYNVVQNIYERRAAGERAARFRVRDASVIPLALE